jgi:histidinol-phosphate phosphatase family protein
LVTPRVNKAVFLDRDGTIARDVPYCSSPEDFKLLPGAADGIRLLNKHGFKVVVVTNQSGIARGYFTEEMLAKIHDKMHRDLAKSGAHIDAIYYCPHHPEDNCECRKPKPKMLLQAASDLNIDLGKSYVIGDKTMDIEMGKNVGCETVLIAEGNKEEEKDKQVPSPDYTASSIDDGAKWIIGKQN